MTTMNFGNILMKLFTLFIHILVNYVDSFPESGIQLSLQDHQRIDGNKWAMLQRWNDKKKFIENFKLVENRIFHVPRSGVYYLSLDLYFEKVKELTLFYINITNARSIYHAKYDISEYDSDIHLSEIFTITENTNISIYTYNNNYLTFRPKTTLSIQYLHSFRHSLGFIASPNKTLLVKNENGQYLFNWQVVFNIFRGFSPTFGSFTSIADGYYIISLKFVLLNCDDLIKVYLTDKDRTFFVFQRRYQMLKKYDTISFTEIIKLKKKDQINLKVHTRRNSFKVLPESKYSIIFLKPYDNEENYRKFLKKQENVTTNDRWHTVINWLDHRFLKGIQVEKRAYYFVVISLEISIYKDGEFEVQLRINDEVRVTRTQYGARGKNQIIIAALLFLGKDDTVSCNIQNRHGNMTILANKLSYITVMQTFHFNYSSLYLSNQQNLRSNRKHCPNSLCCKPLYHEKCWIMNLNLISFEIFSMTRNDPTKSNITITYSGIYFLTMNLQLLKISKSNVAVFLFIHYGKTNSTEMQQLFIFDLNDNVFHTRLLNLQKGDSIAIGVNDSFIYNSILVKIDLQYLKANDDKTKYSHFITNITLPQNNAIFYSTDFKKHPPLTVSDDKHFLVKEDGVYIIALNLKVKSDKSKKKSTIVKIKSLKNKKTSTIKRVVIQLGGKSQMERYINHIYYLEKNEQISIEAKKIVEIIDVSFLLLNNLQVNLISVSKADTSGPYDDENLNIFWESISVTSNDDKPFKILMDSITAQSSFVCLLSIRLHATITDVTDISSNSLSLSIMLNREKVNHLEKKKVNLKEDTVVDIYLAGVIKVHKGDILNANLMLEELQLELERYTQIQIVVLNEMVQNIKKVEHFQKLSEISADSPQPKEVRSFGIYAITARLLSKNPTILKRYPRSLENTNHSGSYDDFFRKKDVSNNSISSFRNNTDNTSINSRDDLILNPPFLNVTNNVSSADAKYITSTQKPISTVSSSESVLDDTELKDIDYQYQIKPSLDKTSKSLSNRKEEKLVSIFTKRLNDLELQIKQLVEKDDIIWSEINLNFSCVFCEVTLTFLRVMTPNRTLDVVNKEHALDTSYLWISDKMENLFHFHIGEAQEVCQNNNFTTTLDGWVSNDENENQIFFYQALAYEIVYVYVNLFATSEVKNSTIWLTVNGEIRNALQLDYSYLGEVKHLYNGRARLFLRSSDAIAVVLLCDSELVTIMSGSLIDVYREETTIENIMADIPIFSEHPYPLLKVEPTETTYECSLLNGDNSTEIYWNKFDLSAGEFEENIAYGGNVSFEGRPENSGYYYCKASIDGYDGYSDIATYLTKDDNECELMLNASYTDIRRCHIDAECTNTMGSYFCKCNPGFLGNGFECEDYDECQDDPCGNFSTCTNMPGNYSCKCFVGFREANGTGFEIGKNCTDIDECSEKEERFCQNMLKSNNSGCENNPGSFRCFCHVGYVEKDGRCVDENECERDPSDFPCHEKASCFNTIGSFKCKCDIGWKGNGSFCEDLDECVEDPTVQCALNATCVNELGSYRCICDRGFKGDGLEECVALGCFPPPVCTGQYIVNWWARSPYIQSGEDKARGLFKNILDSIIFEICDNCSQIVYAEPKNDSKEVEALVQKNVTDFALPLYGSKEQELFRNFPFIPLVESPGVAFFVKVVPSENNPLIGSLTGSWPILVMTLLLASLSGVIIWFLDTVRNPKEFPNSFLEGSWEGFWWAFITMTTVGYGDKAPRSFCARVFGIIWILVGLVIISTFTATITTVLTASSLSNEIKLYGTKVGALSNSEEFRLGVKRNADVVGYQSVQDIINALNNGEVQGVLLDTYIAGEFQTELENYKLQEIFEHVFVYGLALSRDADILVKEFRSYIERKQSIIYGTISQVVKPLRENTKAKENVESSGSLFDSNSPIFLQMVIGGLILLASLLLIGFTWDCLYWQTKAKQKKDGKIKKPLLPEKNGYKRGNLIDYQRKSFRNEVKELKQHIHTFSQMWMERLESMENQHDDQLDGVQKWLKKANMSNAFRYFPSMPNNGMKNGENEDVFKSYSKVNGEATV